MKAAFYAGATGLMAQQKALDTIGQNLVNVNTTGYLPQGTSFEALLSREMYVNAPTDPNTGHGVRAVSTGIRMGDGALRQSGGALDFAIVGDGFFGVENGEEIQYTRDGTFALNVEGTEAFLTTVDGKFIVDEGGSRIELEIDEDTGKYDYAGLLEKLGVYRFSNPQALSPVSGNRYAATALSGEAMVAEEESANKVLHRYLESSGSSMTDEMANMISTQRAYQMSAKVLQTADENEQIINSLRK